VALLKAFESGSTRLPFARKMRGYHRIEVDAYFRKLAAVADNPVDIERPGFTVVVRGYDRAQVDAFLTPLFGPPQN
jgi:DivIVA domain-containing protein